MVIVEYILIIITLTGLIFLATGVLFIAIERLRAKRKETDGINYESISIFKPLKGLDDQLENNLRTFFKLEYPHFELIFGVNDLDDPAIETVKKLQKEYPQIETRLVIDEHRAGLNPKVNNLINMYPQARYDYFLISDSNVRVRSDYLQDLMYHLQSDRVGLVTSTIRGSGAARIGAIFENMHLNTYVAANVYSVARIFRIPVTIGKSMFFRREILQQLGGFQSLRNYLIEDALLGKGIRQLGMKLRTSTHWIDNYNRDWGLAQFLSRHLRWATMRLKLNHFIHYLAELLSYSVFISLLYWIVRRDISGFLFFIGATVIKVALDITAARLLQSDFKWRHYLWIPVKDLVMAAIWPIPLISSTVTWRGNCFRVGKNTLLEPAPKNTRFTVDSIVKIYQKLEDKISSIMARNTT